jgi:hypothetical protein
MSSRKLQLNVNNMRAVCMQLEDEVGVLFELLNDGMLMESDEEVQAAYEATLGTMKSSFAFKFNLS